MNSESCVFCESSVISHEGKEVKGGKNTGENSLALKIQILFSACLQNAAASYSQSFCHRPAVSHSFPYPLPLFNPYTPELEWRIAEKRKAIDRK